MRRRLWAPCLAMVAAAPLIDAAAAQSAQTCRFETLCEPGQACVPTQAFDVFIGGSADAPMIGYSEALSQPATPQIADGITELVYHYANQTETLRLLASGEAELLLPGPDPQTPRMFRGTCAARGQ
ncbi:hypothetical protein V8J82_14635 [Gymnodinialimonas sp. 2305UL16-5]|uniref:hypothetical protein n=1 Tax=Gymnodinialimonas mytili TaxID=3126503 RepID=UPI0030B13012